MSPSYASGAYDKLLGNYWNEPSNQLMLKTRGRVAGETAGPILKNDATMRWVTE